MDINWTVLTALTAIVGAGLGVWNFVHGFSRRRVRLKVIPKLTAIRRGGFYSSTTKLLPDGLACVQVINLSVFPVVIEEAGFSEIGTHRRSIIIPDPKNLLPKRLEPRESIDVRATQSAGFPRTAGRAYASPQCKHSRFGDSIVLKEWRKIATAVPKR